MVEWFVNDVAGIVCSALTYILVLYSQFVITAVILLPEPIVSTAIHVRAYCIVYSVNSESTEC